MPGWQRNNAPKRRNRRLIAIGDLNVRINLQKRALNTKFQTGNVDDASFTNIAPPVWALIETTRG